MSVKKLVQQEEVQQEEVQQEEVQTVENQEGPEANAVLISIPLANALIEFLTKQPMNMVEGLVSGIRSSRPVVVNEETKE